MRLPRWLKKTLLGAGGLLVLVALVVLIGRASFQRIGNRQLAEVTQKLDAEEPGWRFDDLMAARQKAAPPPEVNPADVVVAIRGKLPDGKPPPVWWETGPHVTNEHPGFWSLVSLLQQTGPTAEARAHARDTLLRPGVIAAGNGFTPLTATDNPLLILLPHAQNTREVFSLLQADAALACLSGDPDRAVRANRAGLVAVKAIGDEPFLISQLVRLAGANIACRSAVQTLAWTEPKSGLAELQAGLRAEADHPGLLVGLKGERAAFDKLMDGLTTGKLNTDELVKAGVNKPAWAGPALLLYRGFLPGDRAMGLRILNEHIAAAQLPHHEQIEAVKRIPVPPGPQDGDIRYVVSRLMLPGVSRMAEAHIRTRADLLTASAAVACERFRQKTGRWPKTLDELPKEILPDLPPDPYTGKPFLYEVVADGVMIYSGGPVDDAVTQERRVQENDPMAGKGRGWKLWNPSLRGKTAPAPAREFLPDEFDPAVPGLGIEPGGDEKP